MPVLDGVSSVAKILEFEKQNNLPHIPIVALTANAIKGDKEKFLKSGFDDYLSKPIDKKELIKKLHKLINDTRYKIPQIDKQDDLEVKTDILYDKAKIADEMELPIEFLDQLLEMFFQTSKDDLAGLKKAIEENDYPNIKDFAHSIKGASINLKMINIYEKSQEIEQNAINKKDIDYQTLYQELDTEIKNYYQLNSKVPSTN
jgi:HPt (histidine-containing phosphotransfer) domain-containing protein